uniref:Uncharacterized protein n=1 Tax=Arundo donax TaxID=35708 RepID=A0A0A8ZU23_ARUDO
MSTVPMVNMLLYFLFWTRNYVVFQCMFVMQNNYLCS